MSVAMDAGNTAPSAERGPLIQRVDARSFGRSSLLMTEIPDRALNYMPDIPIPVDFRHKSEVSACSHDEVIQVNVGIWKCQDCSVPFVPGQTEELPWYQCPIHPDLLCSLHDNYCIHFNGEGGPGCDCALPRRLAEHVGNLRAEPFGTPDQPEGDPDWGPHRV